MGSSGGVITLTFAEFNPLEDTISGAMDLKFKEGVLVAAIVRNRKVILPRGNDRIEDGDAVVIVSNHLGLHDITDILR